MCQLAWPSTGSTTTSPSKKGSEPTNIATAIKSAQAAIVTGFLITALSEVTMATGALTSLSTSSGNETTLIENHKREQEAHGIADYHEANAFGCLKDLMQEPAD